MRVGFLSRQVRALAVVALSLGMPVAGFAATMDFSFSFTNVHHGGKAVTGVIRGLQEGTGAASSVEVLSHEGGFGVGEYVGNPTQNSFTVTGGAITAYRFVSFGIVNAAPAVKGSTLLLWDLLATTVPHRAALSPKSWIVGGSIRGLTSEDFALVFTRVPEQPSARIAPQVPLPAAGWAMLAALGGLGALRRRKAA